MELKVLSTYRSFKRLSSLTTSIWRIRSSFSYPARLFPRLLFLNHLSLSPPLFPFPRVPLLPRINPPLLHVSHIRARAPYGPRGSRHERVCIWALRRRFGRRVNGIGWLADRGRRDEYTPSSFVNDARKVQHGLLVLSHRGQY